MPETCKHPKLSLQHVGPEGSYDPGTLMEWYKCEDCGGKFRAWLFEYEVNTLVGTSEEQNAKDGI